MAFLEVPVSVEKSVDLLRSLDKIVDGEDAGYLACRYTRAF